MSDEVTGSTSDGVDDERVDESGAPEPRSGVHHKLVDLSGAVGVSSEGVLQSADLPDNAAVSDDGEHDVSKVGVGSDYPDVGLTPFISS